MEFEQITSKKTAIYLIIPDERYENTEILDSATCYCSDTGVTQEIPLGMVGRPYGSHVQDRELPVGLVRDDLHELVVEGGPVLREEAVDVLLDLAS